MRVILASMRVIYRSKELGKGNSEGIGDRRLNHKFQSNWNVVVEGIIEGLLHMDIDSFLKSWGKVLHSVSYTADEAYNCNQSRCHALTIYQCFIPDGAS